MLYVNQGVGFVVVSATIWFLLRVLNLRSLAIKYSCRLLLICILYWPFNMQIILDTRRGILSLLQRNIRLFVDFYMCI